MKNILSTFAAFGVVAAAAITAEAQSVNVPIGVQIGESGNQGLTGYNGYTGDIANYTAGVASAGNGGDYYVDNWTTVNFAAGGDRSGTDSPLNGSSLIDANGNATGIGFSLAYVNGDNTGDTNGNFPKPDGSNAFPFYANTGDANSVLLGTGVAQSSGPITLTLTGLSAGATYTLVAYVSNLYFAGATTAGWSAAGQTFYTMPTNGTGLTSFVQGTALTPATAAPSNYVEFDNISGLSTLDLSGVGVVSGQPAIMGFQLIETSVPEPSTYVVMLGGLGLMFLGRRLRRNPAVRVG